MPDGAHSDDPGIQRQLDRLQWLSPSGDRLGLERIEALLDRLGRPQDRLPAVLHVAGTNGKGSTCAVLRAAVEAAGGRAHLFTSPHLVRFNERIRVAGRLIEDRTLGSLLERVLDMGADLQPSFFEVTTAVALVAFAEAEADATILEVGLGGRLDATNVVPRPAATGIAALGLDHQGFLGPTIRHIAAEKAGIAKPGVPLVVSAQEPEADAVIEAAAFAAGASLLRQGRDWTVEWTHDGLCYQDAAGVLALSPPALRGMHQAGNAGLAVAMLRHASGLGLSPAALQAAPAGARWPGRLQPIRAGRLADLLPVGANLWIDGAHNPSAAARLAQHFATHPTPLRVVVGLLDNKDLTGLLDALTPVAHSMVAVPVPGHAHHQPTTIVHAARERGLRCNAASNLVDALGTVEVGEDVLVAGSLHLVGEVLRLNGTPPD